ncbi:uncharacterized protein LOC126844129 isoform X2 [Adelges cooleyi]|uniref:uncharacterized protein LOC126844129 isoform X2 n=1 Tax=Adelges cooleyi TaxID=133065 RepID=UPI00218055DF|nr:uncharacterized protein LOC126844129 isoform X2 [Adelges cooleyi]
MEIDDEDVVITDTDLHKYLQMKGYTEFEVTGRKIPGGQNKKKDFISKKSFKKKNMFDQKCKKDFGLCSILIKTILESHLVFKEDALFIKKFVPPDFMKYPFFFTKRNCITLLLLCISCGLLKVYLPNSFDEWTTLEMFCLWFGHILLEIFFDWFKKKKMKNTLSNTIKSMEKSSLLIQKIVNFLQDCNNLHSVYSNSGSSSNINTDTFVYLLMPEMKNSLLTLVQDLIDRLVQSISEVHRKFPLKQSVSKVIYLYLNDCKIDLENLSLENINKAKYTYFLLQSEFLKLSALCLCPALWTSNSSGQMNFLIATIRELQKVYYESFIILSEEYNVYSMFKSNKVDQGKFKQNVDDVHSDLKSKVISVRQYLQNMVVHVRFIEDSVESKPKSSIVDLNDTINVLVKEVNAFNELVSNLQVYILKTNSKNEYMENKLPSEPIKENLENETEASEAPPAPQEDELFFGVSGELQKDIDNKCYHDDIFDKINNESLISELKVALKEKQDEWKDRESKLLKKHPQLNNTSSDDKTSDESEHLEEVHKVRKVARDFPPEEGFPMALPDKNFANEIAGVACRWNNTVIESFGDNSGSDTSGSSTDM